MIALTPDHEKVLSRLKNDFSYFAKHCLRIRTKSGEIKPLALNRGQLFLHERIEKQMRETGRVRVVLLKGRQMGASTYIEARFYWRLWKAKGFRAFILTHEQAATNNLFKMAKRYHDNMPEPMRHPTDAANAKELEFSGRDSSYIVATAGTKEAGRSDTVQLFHGSEVAFWPNAEGHTAGLEQTVADEDGTESILESTANGIGNVFQRRYVAAEREESDEQAIFMPWFWDDGYQSALPEGFLLSRQWQDYKDENRLTDEQTYWAFQKSHKMATATGESTEAPCWKFKQEYPANAIEAFQTAGNSFIPSNAVMKARKNTVIAEGALIIGVDPARGGGDKTGIIDRIGRKLGNNICATWDFDDTMTVVGHVVSVIKKYNPVAVNVDVGGLGAGVYDRLVELGYGHLVNAVNFGSNPVGIGPTGDELYDNRRAEMWDVMRDWFNDPAGVQIPDLDSIHADMTSAVWGKGKTRHKSNNELLLESKDSIRERLGFSPDLGDAAALTFAVPIAANTQYYEDEVAHGRSGTTGY